VEEGGNEAEIMVEKEIEFIEKISNTEFLIHDH
jgi:hypothetical protein